MGRNYIGFYWTLPVNWAGFRNIPTDVSEAAKVSKTIRYQRQRVKGYVELEGGVLIGEIIFMDTNPDRSTSLLGEALAVVRHLDPAGKANIVYVRFAESFYWRPTHYLEAYAQDHGINLLPITPQEEMMDGQRFDPVEHFRSWERRNEVKSSELRIAALEGVRDALMEVPTGRGRWSKIAHKLNEQEILTPRGGVWTPANVQKFSIRHSIAVLLDEH